MHEGTRLIEVGEGEGDAEFHWRQRDTLTDHAARSVEFDDRRPPRSIIGARLQLVDDPDDDVVLDRLVVGRDVAAGSRIPVEVQLADVERVLAERIGYLFDDPLTAEHALRSAEAAKCGIGNRIGFKRLRGEFHMWIEVGIIRMEKGAVGDRPGEIGRITAPSGIICLDRTDAAIVIEADVVVDEEVVALAGGHHVVVAVRAKLDGTAKLARGDRGECRELVALGFLAAKGAAHPADIHCDGVGWNAKHLRDHTLHFAWVLRGDPDRYFVVLAGDSQRDMPFEIEMLLAADPHAPLEPARGPLQLAKGVAPLERQRRGYQSATSRHGIDHINRRRQVAIGDLRKPCSAAGDIPCLGNDRKGRLTMKLDETVGEHRLVMQVGGADVVGMWHVPGGEDGNDARQCGDGGEVHCEDFRMRPVRQAEGAMQRAVRFRHVIDIVGGTRHMLVGAVVTERRMHGAGDVADFEVGFIHVDVSTHATSSNRRSCAVSPVLSRKKRISRFFAASRR